MKILIADDEKDVRDLVRFAFERQGFEIIEAANGIETVTLAQHESPDLILMDVMMPGMNGYEASRELKKTEATKDIPIVFLSARGQIYEVTEGLETGAVSYVIKPFSPKELVTHAKEILQ